MFIGKSDGKLRDQYRIGKILGTGKCHQLKALGAFGEVRMCVHRESGAQRAVKVLRKSHMDEDEKRMLFNEINILKEIVRNIDFRHCCNRITQISSKCMSSLKTRNATIS